MRVLYAALTVWIGNQYWLFWPKIFNFPDVVSCRSDATPILDGMIAIEFPVLALSAFGTLLLVRAALVRMSYFCTISGCLIFIFAMFSNVFLILALVAPGGSDAVHNVNRSTRCARLFIFSTSTLRKETSTSFGQVVVSCRLPRQLRTGQK